MSGSVEEFDGALLEIKQQNVFHHFRLGSEIYEWLQAQVIYWNNLQPKSRSVLDLGNLGSFQLQQAYNQIVQRWTHWANSVKSNPNTAKSICEEISGHGSAFDLIIPEGTIGQHLTKLVSRNDDQQALLIIFTFNGAIASLPSPLVAITKLMKTIIEFHPLSEALADVGSARTSEQIARETAETIKKKLLEFDEWRDREEESIGRLSDRFKKELPFEKPAAHWRQAAVQNYIRVGFFLACFAAFTIVPAWILIRNWTTVFPAVERLFAQNGGTFSLGPVVLLIIPAAAYGWFLKHISRLFIQSYALAIDADHRRSLAITYLGLMDYERTQITDAERAIILNALFRPPPPYSADDGPPMGLLDLIRSSKT
jgi:hypothetical protein